MSTSDPPAGAAKTADAAAEVPTSLLPGVSFAVLAYGWWGFVVPAYIKWLQVPWLDDNGAMSMLLYRGLTAAPVVWLVILLTKRHRSVMRAWRDPRVVVTMVVTAGLIFLNWFGFVTAIVSSRALEAALGYYMTPLLNVALGVVILRERLRPLSILAVVLAAIGVGIMVAQSTVFPWIALVLAGSFSLYGLLRKRTSVGPMDGMAIEMTLVLIPTAVLIVLQLPDGFRSPSALFEGDVLRATGILLAGTSVVLPLVWFSAAARRMPLYVLGLLQFVAPTGQFIMAVVFFGETFTTTHAWTFGFVWTGVALFLIDLARGQSARRTAPRVRS